MKKGEKTIGLNDSQAIQFPKEEKSATGKPLMQKGGLVATTQVEIELNPWVNDVGKTTLSNVLLVYYIIPFSIQS